MSEPTPQPTLTPWMKRLFELDLALTKAYRHAQDAADLDALMRRDMALGVTIDRLTEHVAKMPRRR